MLIMADMGDLADRVKVGDPVYTGDVKSKKIEDIVKIGEVQKIEGTVVHAEIDGEAGSVLVGLQAVGCRFRGMIADVAGAPALCVEAVPDDEIQGEEEDSR